MYAFQQLWRGRRRSPRHSYWGLWKEVLTFEPAEWGEEGAVTEGKPLPRIFRSVGDFLVFLPLFQGISCPVPFFLSFLFLFAGRSLEQWNLSNSNGESALEDWNTADSKWVPQEFTPQITLLLLSPKTITEHWNEFCARAGSETLEWSTVIQSIQTDNDML